MQPNFHNYEEADIDMHNNDSPAPVLYLDVYSLVPIHMLTSHNRTMAVYQLAVVEFITDF